MTIAREGVPIDSPELKAALMRCETCGDSSLYILGNVSGESADMVADIHEQATKATGGSHVIFVKGYRYGEPFPDADVTGKTKYFSELPVRGVRINLRTQPATT